MRRQRKASAFWAAIIAIAAGMGGEMHIYFPGMGTIAMLDLVSYFIALPIIFTQWKYMGKFMRRSLKWAFAWTAASMLANMINFVQMQYYFKCVSLAASSWALMAAGYMLLRNHPTFYLWYLVGTGIGGWISLYYFRNGSLEVFATRGDFGGAGYGLENLVDKQIYPNIARGLFYGGWLILCLLIRKLPILLTLGACVFSGFYLLLNGGSRSSFGMFCGAAAVGFLAAYGSRLFKRIARHSFVIVMILSIGIAMLFAGYKYMARTGMMGLSEIDKYENEFGKGSSGAVKGRAGFDKAIMDALESGGVGKGWHLRNHSTMANSLACEGVVGLLFWVYFYCQCLWFVCQRLPSSKHYAAFIMLMILMACWDAFGSPFGTRHKFFVLMSFIAICRDNQYYGLGTVFEDANSLILK